MRRYATKRQTRDHTHHNREIAETWAIATATKRKPKKNCAPVKEPKKQGLKGDEEEPDISNMTGRHVNQETYIRKDIHGNTNRRYQKYATKWTKDHYRNIKQIRKLTKLYSQELPAHAGRRIFCAKQDARNTEPGSKPREQQNARANNKQNQMRRKTTQQSAQPAKNKKSIMATL